MHYDHRIILLIAYFAYSCFAIIPDVHDKVHHPETQHNSENGHLSLPNLLHIDRIEDLELGWKTLGKPVFELGRLIFKDGGSSVWSLADLENTSNEWTLELVFRSSGTVNDDLKFNEENGFSLWLISSINSLPIDAQNMDNFGGPSQFDGFQFLFNNKGTKGLKIYGSDGSKVISNDLDSTIGNCAFNYLDSQVPFTLRISYSKERTWFKVQIDNNVCFKTDKIKIPEDIGDFSFGVSASSSSYSNEEYELLGLKVWNKLTEDAIDDHGIMSNGHVKVHYTTVVLKPEPTSNAYVKPGFIRESLMARTQRHKEELERQMKEAELLSSQPTENNLDTKIADILFSIERLGSAIDNMENSNDYNSKHILSQIEDLQNTYVQHKEKLQSLQQSLDDFKSTIAQQYSQMLAAFSKFNEKVIGEVREHQYSLDGLTSKVDLLMSNHKEIAYQYQKQSSSNAEKEPVSTIIINYIMKCFSFSLYVGIVFLIIIYREKRSKQHSKLL
ncbi:concanavalin A-like lectin/glucanase [Suhomyces tanzawaensis NRRL Y-17324]|uniref:Concanavalin A-like lectin/glucanase n=1 Tax=Suhomyces tanzawaensis NRRL Y-17324 TaxID=984487 RepID=A0A1E4SNU3_9ASCO|nr:concanavalin A-like lectin/glucanase [Suhomyces tanzawaensis NRRL Y-17324]ODV81183.1 concanavalin A-like lectin/glucanase [Suhomyces tanzawaensis NRRL Y-17324]